ncbi:hypothetical protein OR16_23603 [Cupriavidus basilensis OR16]|uniref:Uncharacterized protein n=1 Tax=Cupriavidus basilensis OR16 TaxID=1127483 RepID=H1S9J0_9BURK|nr:hypothetical protein OR16_23603 [Cupriavidus basilensis OR16]
MAGAKLLGLQGEGNVWRANRLAHAVGTMPNHHHEPGRQQFARRLNHMRKQRPASERMQDLGQRGVHPLAHSCGENDDIHKEGPK